MLLEPIIQRQEMIDSRDLLVRPEIEASNKTRQSHPLAFYWLLTLLQVFSPPSKWKQAILTWILESSGYRVQLAFQHCQTEISMQ